MMFNIHNLKNRSVYAPPQIVRQQQQQKQQQQQSNRTASMEHSAAGMNGAIRGPTAQIQHPGGPMDMMMAQQHQFGMPSGVGSRPGSDLGMCELIFAMFLLRGWGMSWRRFKIFMVNIYEGI
jgi:hypothetical protein